MLHFAMARGLLEKYLMSMLYEAVWSFSNPQNGEYSGLSFILTSSV